MIHVVIFKNCNRNRCILVRRGHVVSVRGRVVDRCNGHRHVGGGQLAVLIGNHVGKRIRAVLVLRRRIENFAVHNRGRAFARCARNAKDGQLVAIGEVFVRIVCQHVQRRRRILVDGIRVIDRRRRVVRAQHVYGDVGFANVVFRLTVVCGDFEQIRSVIVRVRRVDERTVGLNHDRAVNRRMGRHQREGEAVLVDVCRGERSTQRGILFHAQAHRGYDRRVVDARNRNRVDRRRGFEPVADGEVNVHRAMRVLVWHDVDRLIPRGIRRQLNLRGLDQCSILGGDADDQVVDRAFRVAHHKVEGLRHVFQHRPTAAVQRVLGDDRRVVDRPNRYGHRSGRGGTARVRNRIGKGILAVVILGWRIGDARCGKGRRAVRRSGHRGHRKSFAFGIGVVCQHVEGRRCVLVNRRRVVARARRVVGRRYNQLCACARCFAAGVHHGIVKRDVSAKVAAQRGHRYLSAARVDHGAVLHVRNCDNAERSAFHIVIVGKQVHGLRSLWRGRLGAVGHRFRNGCFVIHRSRLIVDRRHDELEGRLGAERSVRCGHGDLDRSVCVFHRFDGDDHIVARSMGN